MHYTLHGIGFMGSSSNGYILVRANPFYLWMADGNEEVSIITVGVNRNVLQLVFYIYFGVFINFSTS